MSIEPFNIDSIDDIVFDDAPIASDVPGTPADPANPENPENPAQSEEVPGQPKPAFDTRIDVLADPAEDPLENPANAPAENPNNTPEAELFSSVAEILKGKGFFSGVEGLEEVTSEDALAEALDKEVQSRLTDRQKEIMQYMNKGVDVTKVDKLKQAITETSAITAETLQSNITLSKQIIATELHHKGLDQDMITRLLSTMEKDETLVVEAEKSLASRSANLNKMLTDEIESADKRANELAETERKRGEDFAKRLESKELFKRKIGKATVDKMKTIQDTVVGYTKDGQALNALMKYKIENPEEFEHKLLYLFAATNGLESLDAFDRSAESRVTGRLSNAVRSMTSSTELANRTSLSSSPVTKINMDDIDDIV